MSGLIFYTSLKLNNTNILRYLELQDFAQGSRLQLSQIEYMDKFYEILP